MKKKIIRFILIIFILIWMYIVFKFSASIGSSSSSLSKTVAGLFSSNIETIKILEPIIRKIAHLSEYAVGRIFVFRIFSYI